MAQAPTYEDVRTQNAANQQAAQAGQNQMATQKGLEANVNAGKNMALVNAMAEYGSRGLSGPSGSMQELGDYSTLSAQIMQAANNNPVEYTKAMMQLAEAGQIPAEAVAADPLVNEVMNAHEAQQATIPTQPGLNPIQ